MRRPDHQTTTRTDVSAGAVLGPYLQEQAADFLRSLRLHHENSAPTDAGTLAAEEAAGCPAPVGPPHQRHPAHLPLGTRTGLGRTAPHGTGLALRHPGPRARVRDPAHPAPRCAARPVRHRAARGSRDGHGHRTPRYRSRPARARPAGRRPCQGTRRARRRRGPGRGAAGAAADPRQDPRALGGAAGARLVPVPRGRRRRRPARLRGPALRRGRRPGRRDAARARRPCRTAAARRGGRAPVGRRG